MIAIHARGNESIGIGNLSRCFELFKFLQKSGEDVVCVFECTKELFGRYVENGVIRSDGLEASLHALSKLKIDVYICDLVDATKSLSDALRAMGVPKIAHFNGLEGGFEVDALFITDGFSYPAPSGGFRVFRGFNYYIVPENLLSKRLKNPKNLNEIKNILISFGGADPAFYTEHFVRCINPDDGREYKVVLGPAMSAARKEAMLSVKKPNLSFVDSPLGLSELILNSDLLLTLGGMSTYEAMCLGVPAAAVGWSYLAWIVKSFGELGMISDLGEISGAYERLLGLNVQSVNEICKNAHKIIDGSALENIKKALDEIRMGK
ncbi:hypothetical protein [Campylobacter sp. 19-13652]|uniref:hypothetical protein n=1 Tax=Campylobacter sp. 19-13652 TaxID=2840180 RepID=UPI001C78BC11|nr:hypothetical protein [Campylobacter sp. 19-13652]BCX79187.1 hypothetical protein LBC_06490 [Campylobacter sp. 19-13652]